MGPHGDLATSSCSLVRIIMRTALPSTRLLLSKVHARRYVQTLQGCTAATLGSNGNFAQHLQQPAPNSSIRRSSRQLPAAPSPVQGTLTLDGHHEQPGFPNLLDLVSVHGARLTTAAQMVWAQVLQPGDIAVDATCGNGNDTLFLAQLVGPTGTVYGIDLQASAVESTKDFLQQHLAAAKPQLHIMQGCHSQMQQLVGSNLAKIVAFNLGYLPGGEKSITTQAGSTIAAVEAALEVVCSGGLISIMAYIGHPGGLEEYDQVRQLLAELSPIYWTSSELKLINRPTAPVLLLLWRKPDTWNKR